jgi:hypothetical protein
MDHLEAFLLDQIVPNGFPEYVLCVVVKDLKPHRRYSPWKPPEYSGF